MPEGQTSLQEAMARIMGVPAGGAPQSPPTAAEAAPKTPYSEDLGNFMPRTEVVLRGGGDFDPFAQQNAELEALRAQTTAMQASLQQQLAEQAARPAYQPPPLPEVWRPPPAPAPSAPAPVPVRSAPPPAYTPPPQPTKTTAMNSAQQYGTNQIYPGSQPRLGTNQIYPGSR
jgi:hypothetical protein